MVMILPLRLALLTLLSINSVPEPDYVKIGIASTFRPHERWNNGKFACGGRWKDPNRPVCAHRWIPCHTWIEVENTKNGSTAWCEVMDRGPYGALTPEGQWVLKRPRDPKTKLARWRGIIDLSPSVSKAIGTNGWARVKIRSWHRKKYPTWHPPLGNSISPKSSKLESWRSWFRSMISSSAL